MCIFCLFQGTYPDNLVPGGQSLLWEVLQNSCMVTLTRNFKDNNSYLNIMSNINIL